MIEYGAVGSYLSDVLSDPLYCNAGRAAFLF